MRGETGVGEGGCVSGGREVLDVDHDDGDDCMGELRVYSKGVSVPSLGFDETQAATFAR